MLLSVIVPVYNAERYLRRCLDSLLHQGLGEDEMEVICVDDGSTDDSLSVLQGYACSHPSVKVYSQSHSGAGAARNIGLKYATGDVVTFCDADDYLIPQGLAYIMTRFWKENVDVICHGSTTLDAKKLKTWRENNDPTGEIVYDGLGRDVYEKSPKYFVWNTIIRRAFVEKNSLSFQPYVMAEDATFLLDLMMAEPRTLDVSCNIYRYTVNPKQVTHSREPQLMRKCIYAYLCFFEKLRQYDLDKVLRTQRQPFYSRVLSAKLSKEEWTSVASKLEKMNVLALPYSIIKSLGFFYRTLFVPYVLPNIGRG